MFPTLRSLVLLVLLAAPGLSSALTTLCVSNSQQLASALQSVNAGLDNLILIKVRRGTYAPPAGSSGFSLSLNTTNRIVDVSGGWSGAANSCTDKTIGASGTLILGGAGGTALKFSLPVSGSYGAVNISDFTFNSPDGGEGACLHGSVSATNTTTVERVRLEGCTSSSYSGSLLLVNSGGVATVRNSVVRGGKGLRTGGINVDSSGGITHLNHLSITANVARLGGNPGGLYVNCNAPCRVHVDNSVVWGNRGNDAFFDINNNGSGSVTLSHVRYGMLNGTVAADGSSFGDPGFVAFGNPGPRSGSPLLNSGRAEVSGGASNFDVDGKPRLQGNAPDIGAHEGIYTGDEIFRDILP
ncbi:choice-of-anchor Q domain-containing protein [Tahibacter harae]|uniref:Parallel beta helix pectate lyase-like protein n=1 Tax=Tahibacter harae TaxID=2963937 RepID=A0ABT1QRF2_9GAMM|nr:choice-of-anchor Q domain-containing protein [Tahibacter harae]MCQ4164885.1 hypothetical protein [Tahibacter harae]